MRVATMALIGLSWATSFATAQTERKARVFDLSFLERSTEPTWSIPGPLRLRSPADQLGQPRQNLDLPLMLGDDQEVTMPGPWLTVAEVRSIIRNYIDEDSWSNRRNQLLEGHLSLVGVQRTETLDSIGRFVEQLRSRCARALSVDVAIVDPDALDRVAPGWDAPSGPAYLPADTLEFAVAASGPASLWLSGIGREGQWLRLVPAGGKTSLLDYSVNQTGVIPVVGPVLRHLPTGPYAEVRVLAAPSRKWFRVDFEGGEMRTGEAQRRRTRYGDLDSPRVAGEHISCTSVVTPGVCLVLGQVRLASQRREKGALAPSNFATILRVRPIDFAPVKEDDSLPTMIDVSASVEEVPDYSIEIDDPEDYSSAPISFSDESPSKGESPSVAIARAVKGNVIKRE
ncbi:MAG: hypothetical protein AAF517_10260, partial [Planctomycetota bacterium]